MSWQDCSLVKCVHRTTESFKHLRGEKNLPFFLLPVNEELANSCWYGGMRTF